MNANVAVCGFSCLSSHLRTKQRRPSAFLRFGFSAVRRVGGKTKRGLGGLGLLGWLRWRGAFRGAGVLRLVSVSGVA